MLQSFQVLAKLPKPVHKQKAKPFSASVHALVGGKKRKRSELAIAVDTEGINLYDIQTSRLVTSYAVSPQATFTCPPCSILRKIPKSAAERLTYCSVVDPSPKLQCFVEQSGKSSGANGRISSTSHNVADSESPIIYLDLIACPGSVGETPGAALVAVHEDGEVRCLSSDLSEEYWNSTSDSSASGLPGGARKICYATIMQLEEARKGLLKNREDLIARVEGIVERTSNSTVSDLLVLLTKAASHGTEKNDETLQLSIYNLHTESLRAKHTKPGRKTTHLEQLTSLMVPQPDKKHDGMPFYFIHGPSGALYQWVDREVRMYDFSGSIPRLVKQVRWKHTIQSCLRLSSTSVILTSRNSVTVLDTQYQSIIASAPIEIAFEDKSNSGGSKKEQIQVLSYFSSQGVAVAIQGRTLVSLQVIGTDAQNVSGRKRARSGKLIDAIGRGMKGSKAHPNAHKIRLSLPESFGRIVQLDKVDPHWEEIEGQLNSRVAQGNPKAFDEVLGTELGIDDDSNQDGQHRDNLKAKPTTRTRLPRAKVNYILSKIFKFEKDSELTGTRKATQPNLMVGFHPKRTLQWLISNGLVSLSHIETALREAGSLSPTSELHSCAVIQALVTCDPSLNALQSLLAAPSFLTTRELVCAARLAIDVLRQSDSSSEPKMITNGEANQPTESDKVTQFSNTNTDLGPISTQNTDKSHNAHNILKHCLSRLRHCHETDIRHKFTQELSHTDLLSFIDFLRMSLARGGWLSRYMDDGYTPLPDEEQSPDQQNAQMSICTTLLNCAFDALGTSGWITSSSPTANLTSNVETIAYMKAEVSAALEGIEEAAYLKAMLNEVLLYSKTVKMPNAKPEGDDEVKPVKVTVESWEDHVLPVGLKAEGEVSLVKVGAGGVVGRRSQRDIGHLKSRKVGAYGFERIVI
ncbi:hypothetical protein MMC30_007781 [Trapelia coarctata]|nr:hypothetical protein [Trapelia coarctata]